MSKEKWYVNSNGRQYEWKEVEKKKEEEGDNEEVVDIMVYDEYEKLQMFVFLLFVCGCCAVAVGGVFTYWLSGILIGIYGSYQSWMFGQLVMFGSWLAFWVFVVIVLGIIIHARIGRLLAMSGQ